MSGAAVPGAWYNILPDLDFGLPDDLPSPARAGSGPVRLRIPPALLRQEQSRERWLTIPDEVRGPYRQWRPTPLRRAEAFERALDTRCRIYYKYEGGNLSGSHKLNTAVAQAYYYRRVGATRLTVGTGAGQWGTAVAAACAMFGLACTVYMVRSSYLAKPYRRSIMELLGATVHASPSEETDVGRDARAAGERDGSLSIALGEALADTAAAGTFFCTGSGETYTLLHQTVIGLEAVEQLAALGVEPDVVVGALGAGSNFGGLALPFLGSVYTGRRPVRCVAVEPSACPKLTMGRYAYDHTDASGRTPLQKMYTLGHAYAPPAMHAGGLRYHGTAKLVSALYDRGLVEAMACPQRAVFGSAVAFARAEGVLPAPESAHAVHGAVVEARRADAAGRPRTILVGVSGHGYLDLAAYDAYHSGAMRDLTATPEQVEASLRLLPAQPVRAR